MSRLAEALRRETTEATLSMSPEERVGWLGLTIEGAAAA